MKLPPIPAKPKIIRSLLDFSILPSDTLDQSAVLQKALDTLKPGDWLTIPSGMYLHGRSLRVNVPGVVIWGEPGHTFRSTNPDDTAIAIYADNVEFYNLHRQSITNTRKQASLCASIAIIGSLGGPKISGSIIRRCLIEEGDDNPGQPLSNGSSAVGILIHHADRFLIAENVVSRTLADGIHSTQGSINGRVLWNTVRQTGDDMIACVSYLKALSTGMDMQRKRADALVRNILIANNTVGGQYNGRGITVVGGEDIRIENNIITDTTHAAGIMIAREANYQSFGVRNMTVRGNSIRRVQTTIPVYQVPDTSRVPTGHAGIEVNANYSPAEAEIPELMADLQVRDILIEDNDIEETKADGIRINVRGMTAPQIGNIGLVGNRMSKIGDNAIEIQGNPTPWFGVCCYENSLDGEMIDSSLMSCGAPPEAKE